MSKDTCNGLSLLAARLRGLTPPNLPGVGRATPVGYYRRGADTFFSVQLRITRATYTVGETANENLAAVFSDCVQLHFEPWMPRTQNPLRAFNFGPAFARFTLASNPEIAGLIGDLETCLVAGDCIRPRSEREANRAAPEGLVQHAEQIQNLILRVAALEKFIAKLPVRKTAPAVVNFTPPGEQQTFTSVNSDVTKRLFKI